MCMNEGLTGDCKMHVAGSTEASSGWDFSLGNPQCQYMWDFFFLGLVRIPRKEFSSLSVEDPAATGGGASGTSLGSVANLPVASVVPQNSALPGVLGYPLLLTIF